MRKIADSALGDLAAYTYAGTSRRVETKLGAAGNVVQASLPANETGYTGLDRWGRLADLHFKNGDQTLHRYQYGYDAAGNRLHALVTQVNRSNTDSYLYGYPKRWQRIILEPGTWSGEDIFVARGLPGTYLASARFKTICDEHAITNVVLIPAEEYAHDFYPWERRRSTEG